MSILLKLRPLFTSFELWILRGSAPNPSARRARFVSVLASVLRRRRRRVARCGHGCDVVRPLHRAGKGEISAESIKRNFRESVREGARKMASCAPLLIFIVICYAIKTVLTPQSGFAVNAHFAPPSPSLIAHSNATRSIINRSEANTTLGQISPFVQDGLMFSL